MNQEHIEMNVDVASAVSVSVVIPCFRCSGTIIRAIESIAHQTSLPAEVILVEDASGDETLPVLKQLEKANRGWIKVLQLNENRGAASARNAGWAAASQSYIAFLDADDAWHPGKIQIQYAFMNAHQEVVLCGHGHKVIKPTSALPDWEIGDLKAQHINKWPLLLSNRFVTPSAMVRRDAVQRFVEGQRYMEDHMLWLRVVCGGSSVVKLSVELAAIYKSPFGVQGLSARMWPMEREDLGNYRRLYRDRCINGFQLSMLSTFSLLKYMRRVLIYLGYLRWKQ